MVEQPNLSQSGVRPLRRLGVGRWRSRDGRWTFLRHESDPHPRRWYVYDGDDEWPSNDGTGITTLGDAVDWTVGAVADELKQQTAR